MGRLTCWTSLVVLAIFLCHLQSSAACSCPSLHPQTHFCQSHFVALVTVEEFTTVNGAAHSAAYTVNVNQTFKATPSARIALDQKPLRLWTRSSGSLCGLVHLSAGETWVIGGYMNGDQLHVDICGLSLLWSEVTPDQRESFQHLYQDGCVCQISSHPTADKNECWWQIREKGRCQDFHGVCTLSSGECSWIHSVPYDECFKLHPIEYPTFTF